MRWKTQLSFLKWLKAENTEMVPEDGLKVEKKRSYPLSQLREAVAQSSTLRRLRSGPFPAMHLSRGSLETPNITSTQAEECHFYPRKENRIFSLPGRL